MFISDTLYHTYTRNVGPSYWYLERLLHYSWTYKPSHSLPTWPLHRLFNYGWAWGWPKNGDTAIANPQRYGGVRVFGSRLQKGDVGLTRDPSRGGTRV